MNRTINPARPMPVTVTPTTDEPVDTALYRHDSRPGWGYAARIATNGLRVTFQFSDGELRKIASTHLHLLSEVDLPRDESDAMQDRLARMAGLTLGRKRQANSAPLISLDEQVALFLSDYQEGFQDAAYTKKHRGGGKRVAKSHRDAAVKRAQETLARHDLLMLVAAGQHREVMDRVLELAKKTNLVTKKQLAPLQRLDDNSARRAAGALSQLLYGDVDTARAMQDWIDALALAGKGVSWSLATAIPALVQPDKHVCVRPSVIGEQARWMAPRITMNKTPSGELYLRLLRMAERTLEELRERDLEPRDMLDLYDFVWLTLRPAAKKRIAELDVPASQVRVREADAADSDSDSDADEALAA